MSQRRTRRKPKRKGGAGAVPRFEGYQGFTTKRSPRIAAQQSRVAIPPSHVAKPTTLFPFVPEVSAATEGVDVGLGTVCGVQVVSIVRLITKVDVAVVTMLCSIKVRVVVLLGTVLVVVEVSVRVVEILCSVKGGCGVLPIWVK